MGPIPEEHRAIEAFQIAPGDRSAVERQVGRPLRGRVRVAARCPCGLPCVVETFPMVDGRPFPTLYWLTCARALSTIGRLEGEGRMAEVNMRLREDPAFAVSFDAAQRDYVARRDALCPLPEAGGVGGGPMDRVKCLHAHYAHHLATGGNPVGAWVEEVAGPVLRPPPCVDPEQAGIDQ